jgi:hypothetical protein
VGQLLGHHTAEGDAEHIDGFEAENIQQPLGRASHASHPSRPGVGSGLAYARSVVADRPHAEVVQLALERDGNIEARADATDQQKRDPIAAAAGNRNAEPCAVHIDELDLTRRHRHR